MQALEFGRYHNHEMMKLNFSPNSMVSWKTLRRIEDSIQSHSESFNRPSRRYKVGKDFLMCRREALVDAVFNVMVAVSSHDEFELFSTPHPDLHAPFLGIHIALKWVSNRHLRSKGLADSHRR